METILIDGAAGEGGGQVLRTALGLSIATGRPFRIQGIRAGRSRPGLLRQHLASVRAAALIGRAEVEGDALGSMSLAFRPTTRVGGDHHAVVGSAGSAMLVIQAVLPGLLVADAPSRLIVEGGTHNPAAPPFDFVRNAFVPLLARMGARVDLTLDRAGFYPAGGGRVVMEVTPGPLRPIEILERGELRALRARAIVSGVPRQVANRELHVLRERFSLAEVEVVEVVDPVGPGNVVLVEAECEALTEVFTGFGERGVRAEEVARQVGDEAQAWLDGGAPVGPHLADQLLVPFALAGGGRFRSGPLSSHTTTNTCIVCQFMNVSIHATPRLDGTVEVVVQGT